MKVLILTQGEPPIFVGFNCWAYHSAQRVVLAGGEVMRDTGAGVVRARTAELGQGDLFTTDRHHVRPVRNMCEVPPTELSNRPSGGAGPE